MVELGPRWELDESVSAAAVVCGRPPLRSMAKPALALVNATRRATFIRRCERTRASQLRAVLLLPPPPGSSLPAVGALRERLLSGALVLLTDDPQPTLLDAVARAAGSDGSPRTFHVPGDGSAVARITTAGGQRILRFARAGDTSDPSWIAEGLTHLERSEVGRVPRLDGRGEELGYSWMTESVLAGREPRRLDERLWDQLVSFCGRLPRSGGPPTGPDGDLTVVARLLPDRADAVEVVRQRIAPRLLRLPGVARHGDFWAGNLLTQEGRLSGVVDWAAWHPAGAPGEDLVHLFAADRKKRARGQLGDMWASRPWRQEDFLRLTAPYWRSLDLEPAPADLDAIALAWWASWVAQSLSRHPGRAQQRSWLEGNVNRVLDDLPA